MLLLFLVLSNVLFSTFGDILLLLSSVCVCVCLFFRVMLRFLFAIRYGSVFYRFPLQLPFALAQVSVCVIWGDV